MKRCTTITGQTESPPPPKGPSGWSRTSSAMELQQLVDEWERARQAGLDRSAIAERIADYCAQFRDRLRIVGGR